MARTRRRRTGNGAALRQLRRLGALVFLFLAWWAAAELAGNRLFPTPIAVFDQLGDLLSSGVLLDNAAVTYRRAFIGLGIAIAAGVTLGTAMARNRVVEAMFEPLLAAFYPVPKIALYPLFILVLGFGAGAKIALVALECAYPIAYNTFSGVQGIPRRYFWLARNVGAGRLRSLGMALRAASPSLLAGLRIAVPIMLVIIVITELLGESVGLGFLIRSAGSQFLPAQGLAVVLFLAITGYVLDRLLLAATRVIAFWQKGAGA